jgi:hypothetical protein
MIDLSLEEAAKHVGLPPRVLHVWAWSGVGPKAANTNKWKPRFTEQSLNEWMKSQGVAYSKQVH